jgi:tRNA pseudouridine38-40 synthase
VSRYKITVAYDGTDFVGWQRQASGVSIQSLLEDALRDVDGRDVTVTGAGRTDAGVHALAQVAAFTLERTMAADAVARALNAKLPPAVRIVAAEEAPASFHPRFDVRDKTYRYRISNAEVLSPFERRYAWHVPGALDVGAMREAARALEGTHDFAAFQSVGSDAKTTVRTVTSSRIEDCGLRIESGIESSIHSAIRDPQSAMLVYEITGTGFLRHMVRAIVGSLVEVGRRRRAPSWIVEVMSSRARASAGPTAPPDGLFLVRVNYG